MSFFNDSPPSLLLQDFQSAGSAEESVYFYLLTCPAAFFLHLLSISLICYLIFYLNIHFHSLFSVEFFLYSLYFLLPHPSPIILFFLYCLPSHISAAILLTICPPVPLFTSFPAASPLCCRSIESLPDNQKYRQLQKELSQVLTQRQIFID